MHANAGHAHIWDELFEEGELLWKEPHEGVVAVVPELQDRGLTRVFDLGCGAGRHLIYLAREGFEVHGADVSDAGLYAARRWLRREGLAGTLTKSAMTALPYDARSFDAVVSLYVIYHGTVETIGTVLDEIRRVLRPGGLALLNFISRRTYSYGNGREIAPNTFVSETSTDAGVPHHFSDEAEVRDLLSAFTIRRLERDEHVDDEGQRHSHWLTLAEC